MVKRVRGRKPSGSEPAAAVVEKETGIKKHKSILILIAALVLLILIATSLRTEASPERSGLSIKVSQDGISLTATVSRPERAGNWQFVRTGEQVCGAAVFSSETGSDEPPALKLTATDHGQYYCFRAMDSEDGYSYQLSEIIDLMNLYEPPAINIRQLNDVLLAETAGNDAGNYAWRAAATSGEDCDAQTFANQAAGGIRDGNIFMLRASDVGQAYCFETEHPIGFKEYKLSKTVAAFEETTGEGLAVEQDGEILIARRFSGSAEWRAASVSGEQFCSHRPFGLATSARPAGAVTYVNLYSDDNGRRYCFQAYVGEANQPEYVLSDEVTGVENSRPREGYSRLAAVNYPYGVPETYPTGLQLRSTVSLLLTPEGRGVLEGLTVEMSAEPDCAGGLTGCYWVGSSHSADAASSKIIIKAVGKDYYEGFSFRDKAQVNHVLLTTLIRELMHAVDLGDGNMAGGHRLRYKANTCQATALAAAADNYDAELSSVGQLGSSDPALAAYGECLDDEDELFGMLRQAYQALPAGDLLDESGRWSGRGLAMHPAAANAGNHAAVGKPGWYAELYAQLVFERELPQALEDHYAVYFTDRQAVADIFTVNLSRP
ncbi:hypothetical protein F4X86_00935 [Candidatus Saccharibacteria bacterium]|nr:hypothetical protein [Candidatus Saccharibacteria bacterium]